ncbi:hypothetical protein Poly24_07540 [Rosistilla carotiformis]|uniref:Uncharacterized protein n=1 Tax=Rosistilla carotiformis TaxID=2528017 RepID=A0A518JNE6_9BACT|nr:hypothetical protein [Rosistilla carotiformis]QDV67063.1 hypothetical protein Poly24_07540 [Rosistilla carotiformis]
MNSSQPPDRTIQLARQSTRWSQADSAGGYTMRYITAMRNYLIDLWGDGEAADKSLVLLLGHLASKGFGESEKGRLRDYLLRSARAAATAQYRREPTAVVPPVDQMQVDDPAWIQNWQECLLARVWRGLERFEHANPTQIEYSALRMATDHPSDTTAMLAVRVSKLRNIAITPQQFSDALRAAQLRFAQLIADEVTDTLESPTTEDVNVELSEIGLRHLVDPFLGNPQ